MARNILSIAVPMTVAQVVNILYSLVDRMYIGHIPGVGHTSLTGMGLTLPLISIVLAFANLGGMGGSPLCSIYRGKGEEGLASAVMGNTLSLLLFFGFAIPLVTIGQHPVPAVVLWVCHPSGDHSLFGPHSGGLRGQRRHVALRQGL